MGELRNEKGSYTIEASLVFVTIMLSIAASMFMFMYMQQKACLINAVSFAAQQGAEFWPDGRKRMEDGRVNAKMAKAPLGYRVFNNLLLSDKTYEGYLERVDGIDGKPGLICRIDAGNDLPGQKVKKIGEALGKKIDSFMIKPDKTKVKIIFTNNALRGRLTVEVIQEIKVPFGGLKQFFDGKNTLVLSAASTAEVVEPDEFIRNVDLVFELSKRLGEEVNLRGIFDKVKSEVKN